MMKRRKTEDTTHSLFSSSSLLKVNQLHYDRDSGIMTENESDMEGRPNSTPALIFSDDDNNEKRHTERYPTQSINAAFSSPTYYTSLADQAVNSLRTILNSQDWKKVLKHKSGTTIYMSENSQSKSEKTAIFKGEAIIDGFTPQSIFYVIGMRKLWDEQFDEGKLIENLNETTSITYESYKSSGTSKAYDLSLVEKIECSSSGEIVFACTSVDTPNVPKIPGKNRNQVKLQGWILKPIRTSPASTKVTYITQESIKGWIPGLTKKSLARKPLIIATIDDYLRQKAASRHKSTALIISPPIPSKMPTNSFIQPNSLSPQTIIDSSHNPRSTIQRVSNHSNTSINTSFTNITTSSSSTLNTTTTTTTTNNNNNNTNSTLIPLISHPPPRKSSLLPSPSNNPIPKKRITFADEVNSTRSTRSISPFDEKLNTINELPDNSITLQPLPPIPTLQREVSGVTKTAFAGSKLYPSSRHRTVRKESMDRFHALMETKEGWNLINQRKNLKTYSMSTFLKSETTIWGTWTPEQICSVIQCFGARKIWDEHFEQGDIVERFSQKEYLIHASVKDMDFCALMSIESNMSTGGIYIASSSVEDGLVPETERYKRGEMGIYGFALEPLKREQRLVGTKVTLIQPLALPLSDIERIEQFLNREGCPPYIRRVAGKVTLEHFENRVYRMSFIAKHAPSSRHQHRKTNSIRNMWCTDLRIHPSMYPYGCEITTEPEGVRVEVRPDGSGLRIFTERSEMDGKVIRLLIEPILSRVEPPQFIWNHTPLILENPVVRTVKRIVPEKLKEEEEEEEEEDEKEVVEKTVFRRRSSRRRSRRSMIMCNKKDNHMSIKEDETDKTEETHFIERRNSHIIIISEELSFTGHQFSFIILLMAVCYYLGKFSCRCTL